MKRPPRELYTKGIYKSEFQSSKFETVNLNRKSSDFGFYLRAYLQAWYLLKKLSSDSGPPPSTRKKRHNIKVTIAKGSSKARLKTPGCILRKMKAPTRMGI